MKDVRILVAETDPRSGSNLCEMLERLGYLVVGEANDGLSAVSLTRQFRPDVVLLEVHLPVIDGFAVAKVFSTEGLTPVILISSTSTPELAEQARDAGVLGYLMKPLQESELVPSIEIARARWLDQQNRHRELTTLKDKLETRRVIERAKGYLMDSQGLHETDAFRKMQRLAMNSRKTMREIAQAILLTQQLHP